MNTFNEKNDPYFTHEIETSHTNSVCSWERVSPVSSDKGEFSPLDPLHQDKPDDQREPLETPHKVGQGLSSHKPHNPPNRIRSEFWLSPNQKVELQRRADADRVSKSAYIRNVIFEQKYKNVKKRIDPDLLEILKFRGEMNGLKGAFVQTVIKTRDDKNLNENVKSLLSQLEDAIGKFSDFIDEKTKGTL